jgi:hypothetical protein
MSGAGGGGGGYNAGASKKPRLADSENESEHIVSMMQIVHVEQLCSFAHTWFSLWLRRAGTKFVKSPAALQPRSCSSRQR